MITEIRSCREAPGLWVLGVEEIAASLSDGGYADLRNFYDLISMTVSVRAAIFTLRHIESDRIVRLRFESVVWCRVVGGDLILPGMTDLGFMGMRLCACNETSLTFAIEMDIFSLELSCTSFDVTDSIGY